mgnify:CR=1 FL=1
MDFKRCTKCYESKSYDGFRKKKGNNGYYLNSACWECERKYDKEIRTPRNKIYYHNDLRTIKS